MGSPEPPLLEFYESLIGATTEDFVEVEECELPVIDLSRLSGEKSEIEECKTEIMEASQEWGFFQVLNHGICEEVLERMRDEQVLVFRKPFTVKEDEEGYRWGTHKAKVPRHLSWSEAFHVPMTTIEDSSAHTNLSSAMQQFATPLSDLAQKLAEILAEKMGQDSTFFKENCLPKTCYVRMNRYPPCPISSEVFGLVPHTDSDFLTILHPDQIGGLQIVKDGRWIAVKPNQERLVINIGDLFQAWSNGVYKSVEHRVVTNKLVERFSAAFFFCPSNETMIQSPFEPFMYKNFTFGEFRKQVQQDVQTLGTKIGLPRFLAGSQ